ncbi:hypothetical protein QMK33_15375 [Hymenobacter sp. H14-R3]|uniref:hypothetical protein n=1 Tax=Hymenobacter sp. H14-R3 TaxID=3046308 RepID=UPI0024B901B9|nr:hypothetical protein [Hymenobacter sp. H14-R3]MDJ0366539.1 hypothetical protein [Hymenobacter sp. H14-R3]
MTAFRWSLLLSLVAGLAGPAQAQQAGSRAPDYRFSRAILAQWQHDSLWANYQNYAVQFSRIGDYPHTLAAQSAFEKGRGDSDRNVRFDPAYAAQFHAVAAQPELLRRTATRQLVLFNEAHYQPLNRVFTRSMLAGLYGQGFRYLCVEDLANGPLADTQLNQRKYPTRATGFYQPEPQYGELLRTALALGFTLVPYEYVPTEKAADPMAGLLAREMGQARNIQQILTRDPRAKIVVHVGYGHLVEQLNSNGNGSMGGYLKKYTGLDPFTIHQVDLLEHADPQLDNPYRALLHADQPSVFVNAQGALFNSPRDSAKWDVSVYFPATTYAHGRPTWLLMGGRRRYYPLTTKNLPLGFPCLVRAYHAGEDVAQAIPADVVEWQDARQDLALVLGPGRYALVLEDAQGHTRQQAIRVR